MKKLIILIILLLLTGCYNYKELNKIGIVSSISIDKKEDKYLVGAQVINIKNENDSETSNVIVFEEDGYSIEDALRKMTNKSDKKLYGGHFSKLVISEEVAKESIINVLDLFQRLPEVKDEFTITVVKNINAIDVIKVMTSGSIPADYVTNIIKNADLESALTYSSKLDEFMSFYLKDYIDPVISTIEVENYNEKGTSKDNIESTSPNTKIILSNIGITYKGKLEKFLDEDETIGYNYILDNIDEMIIPIKCDNDNYASISITDNKTKTSVNDDYEISLDIKSNANINEYNCDKKIDEKEIKELEKKTEDKIKEYINKAIDVQNNSNSEFLGFKRIIYLSYPNYNNEDYSVKTNIKVNIFGKGVIDEN